MRISNSLFAKCQKFVIPFMNVLIVANDELIARNRGANRESTSIECHRSRVINFILECIQCHVCARYRSRPPARSHTLRDCEGRAMCARARKK